LNTDVRKQLVQLLEQYKLPTSLRLHPEQLMDILIMDKKRSGEYIDFVLLNSIGSAYINPLPFETIQQALEQF
jgi:3-dehydroquinate synthetase